VRDRRDPDEVGGDAVVRRTDDVNGLDVGMRFEGCAHRLRRDGVVHVQVFIDFRLHPHRVAAAHDQAAHRALVRVTRDRDLLARIQRGHHHALVAAGRTVDQEVGMLSTERVGGQLLRFDQRPFGL
jgi:hypothetical protein